MYDRRCRWRKVQPGMRLCDGLGTVGAEVGDWVVGVFGAVEFVVVHWKNSKTNGRN